MKKKLAVIILALVFSMSAFSGCDLSGGKAGKVSVTFDSNGGTGTMNEQLIDKNSPSNLNENKFTKTSFTFAGWNTAEEGSGTAYADKASITISSDLKLYAQWERYEHTVTLKLADDDSVIGTIKNLDSLILDNAVWGALSLVPEKPGYMLDYWYTDRDCSKSWLADNLVTADLTLYCRYVSSNMYSVYALSDTECAISARVKDLFRGDITIPDFIDGKKVINIQYFNDCTDMTSVTIPEGVTSIGDRTFEGCTSLSNVSIPSTVTSIGLEAFKDTKLWSDTPNNSLFYIGKWLLGVKGTVVNAVIKDGTEKMADGIFSNYAALETVTIPESVKEISSNAFACAAFGVDSGLASLHTVNIQGEGLLSIGFAAFNYCTALENINIPNSVTSIGKSAFTYCKSLISIVMPANLEKVADSTFDECENLESVTLNESLKEIGEYAFSYCPNLEKAGINIPSGVTRIGTDAFYYSGIYLAEEYSPTPIYHDNWIVTVPRALLVADDYTITDGTIGITDSAFNRNRMKKSGPYKNFIIPASVKYIGEGAFCAISDLESITVDAANENYKSVDGALYSKDGKTLVQYPIGKTEFYVDSLPNGIEEIGTYAFAFGEMLIQIVIPDSVTTIDKYAFYNCVHLINVTIGAGVTDISDFAFGNCKMLTEIVIPDNVTTLGRYVFYSNEDLEYVILGSGISKIGDSAFYDCKKITSIIIPSGAMLGTSVFYGWTNEQTVNIKTHTQKPDGWNAAWKGGCGANIVWNYQG